MDATSTLSFGETMKRRAVMASAKMSQDNWILLGLLTLIFIFMMLFIIMPLWAMMKKSVQNSDGDFVGLDNFWLFRNG